MNIPLSAINISEEVDKTGIWKHVNNEQNSEVKDKRKSPKTKNRFKKKKQSKKDEIKREEQLEKRLSTCKEEDDEGITIKVIDTSLHI
ncbi:unnamed protein product [Phaedon cochleariae]|uniref:Uncharacterized protein n=1 Tax=Phaedon cochleariae TaxID=80249 RepID=A0A9N9SKE0_PHACE|nr:unnamed protein product [Phaedon cochleariae]